MRFVRLPYPIWAKKRYQKHILISFIIVSNQENNHVMLPIEEFQRPSKADQLTAMASYDALSETIKSLQSDSAEIEIEETGQKITVPLQALKLFTVMLKSMAQGKIVNLVPVATEVTTQVAAEMMGCSRPHFVKLLESGEIEFTKVGRHRRVKHQDVLTYKAKTKQSQKQALIDMMRADEKSGLYDS